MVVGVLLQNAVVTVIENYINPNEVETAMNNTMKTPQQKVQVKPLTDDELNFLDMVLDRLVVTTDSLEHEPLTLDAVDGLFAALAISPKVTAIAEWMALVVGEGTFANKEETQTVRNLLIRHYNSVVHLLRKADIEDYQPLVSYNESDQPWVAAWCAGFIRGFERQEEAWAKQMDDGAWAEIHVLYALRESDEFGEIAVPEDADGGEMALIESRIALVALMREEVGALLEESADDLALLLFALAGLQETMLAARAPTSVKQPGYKR